MLPPRHLFAMALSAVIGCGSLIVQAAPKSKEDAKTAKEAPRDAKGAASVKPPHVATAAALKAALAQVDAANKELEVIREEGKKAALVLKEGNSLIAKGKRLVMEGQKAQKAGRELKKRGKEAAGDAKIIAGTKAIDDGAKDMALGVTQVKNAQATLNGLHARATKARVALEDAKKVAKIAEANM